MKLLLIEDDAILSRHFQQILSASGYIVETAGGQEAAELQVEVNDYNCLILDLGLPDGSGFEFLRDLRDLGSKTPVVIVTARGQVEERIKGLNLGADDYLPKPVNPEELVARIRAVIRRHAAGAPPIIKVGALTVKPNSQEASIKDQRLNLTAKEFAVLEYLALHHGEVVTRSMLMEHVWGSDFDTFSNVIDVYIKNLRRKISTHSPITLIHTIRGKGYILQIK